MAEDVDLKSRFSFGKRLSVDDSFLHLLHRLDRVLILLDIRRRRWRSWTDWSWLIQLWVLLDPFDALVQYRYR